MELIVSKKMMIYREIHTMIDGRRLLTTKVLEKELVWSNELII